MPERDIASFNESINLIDSAMVAALMYADPNGWREVTVPMVGDNVIVFLPSGEEVRGEILNVIHDYEGTSQRLYAAKRVDGKGVIVYTADKIEVLYNDILPSADYMISFKDNVFDKSIELTDDALEALTVAGFRIFKSDEFGYFIGFDREDYEHCECDATEVIQNLRSIAEQLCNE